MGRSLSLLDVEKRKLFHGWQKCLSGEDDVDQTAYDSEGQKDDDEQEAADDQVGPLLLLRTGTGDAEGVDEGFG